MTEVEKLLAPGEFLVTADELAQDRAKIAEWRDKPEAFEEFADEAFMLYLLQLHRLIVAPGIKTAGQVAAIRDARDTIMAILNARQRKKEGALFEKRKRG